MDWQATGLRRLDGIIWAVIASVAGLVLLTAPLYGFHLVANHTVVPASSTSWLVFLGLRDGGYRLLRGLGPEGIITFPSLHAALAVIIVAAVHQSRGLVVAARAWWPRAHWSRALLRRHKKWKALFRPSPNPSSSRFRCPASLRPRTDWRRPLQ